MPRTTFAPENKNASAQFPKLSLEKGETARIFCIEADNPLFEFVHTLRACSIGPDGKPIMETVQSFRGEQQRIARDFVGRPLCFGDINILLAKGIDPENCPICAASARGEFVDPPERRFAMHVIRYSTRPGTFELAQPFSCSSVVWAFTDKTFNKLSDLATEWEGGFKAHDLNLGPCTNKAFQNFEINIAGNAAAMANQQVMQVVVDTYKNNQAPDLSVFCGRRSEMGYVMSDLQNILRVGRQAYGQAAPAQAYEPVAGVGTPGISIDDLLSAQANAPVAAPSPAPLTDALAHLQAQAAPQPTTPVSEAPPAAPAIASMDELMAQLKGTQEASAPVPAPAPEPPTETTPQAPPAAPPSFEDLLAGLTSP